MSQGESAVTESQASADQAEPAEPLDEPDERDEPVAADEADVDTDEADVDTDEASYGEDDDPGREDDGTAAPGLTDVADLELEGEVAADYIEGLLDVADLDGDIDMDVEGDRALVSVVGATLDELVGSKGEVLEALQELTRLAVHRHTGMRTRIMIDVGGYRQRKRAELAETGRDAADEVKRTGVPKKLWAMNPFERKIVHDAVAAAGLRSESEGEEPDRRVVVLPGN